MSPTTHVLTVALPKTQLKEEPVSPCLAASLIHPDRKAVVWTVEFSSDGRRLFTAGYPSGIVQIWDIAARRDMVQINTPPGLRGSAHYAVPTPDWSTLYVPVERRSVTPLERNGKRFYHIQYAGQIRVWDLATGKEKPPLQPDAGTGCISADMSPNGRLLISVERPGYFTSESPGRDCTVVWDLATRRKRKLSDGYADPSFAPDGKSVVVTRDDYKKHISWVELLDLATGKELARWTWPEKERFLSVAVFSPDGSAIAVPVGGKKGAPVEERFLDGKTLKEQGKLVGDGASERYGWSSGRFTPDGRHFVLLDGVGKALIWDVVTKRLEGSLPLGGDQAAAQLAISPDGRTLAAAWMAKIPPELAGVLDPDPRDLPQPHVSLVDMDGKAPPRILVAPHGFLHALAFSPDGNWLACGSSGAVHLFDLSRLEKAPARGHKSVSGGR